MSPLARADRGAVEPLLPNLARRLDRFEVEALWTAHRRLGAAEAAVAARMVATCTDRRLHWLSEGLMILGSAGAGDVRATLGLLHAETARRARLN
jgi:hypothetical protein